MILPCTGQLWRRRIVGLSWLAWSALAPSAALAQATASPVLAPVTQAGLTPPVTLQPEPAATAVPPEPRAPHAPSAVMPPSEPPARLDYSDGSFYLRSINDNIVFMPAARMHIDTYSFAGPGVSDYHRSNGSGLKTNLFFRRFIIEFGGLIRQKWFYWFGGNFGQQQLDGNQSALSSANVYDGFIGYMPTPRIRIYLGQYNAPFTMENVTSSRWMDMMERALSVRTLATPYNKADGLMVWGETEHKHFEYQLGIFGGDGMNRPNLDNRFDGMGRFVVRPLASRSDALKRFHVGGGARLGFRDNDFTLYDAPALSTPGGYQFWAPGYTDADGAKIHVLTAGRQAAASAEFYLPFERWDVRGEFVYVNEGRHEVAETDRTQGLRSGTLSGVGAYGQLSVWLLGTPRIAGNPGGTYGLLKLPDSLGAQAPYALQMVARAELLRVNYDANSRAGSTPGGLSAATNNIDVNAYQLGLNYWATKHIRLTAEYSLYQFLNGPNTNQAVAPGVKSKASPDANVLHEISFRAALAI